MSKGGIRVSRNKLVRLVMLSVEDLAPGDAISAAQVAEECGLTEDAAKDLLNEMSDAGDIDKFFPPNEPGKRGRSAAVYRKMTTERAKALEGVISAREAVSRALKDYASSNVTLRKVTLSLQDACALIGVPVPADPFVDPTDTE